MALEVDPANQFSGLLKWASGIIAGFLVSKFKLDITTAGGIAGAILTLATGAWQVIHRLKTGRAMKAVASLPPSAPDSAVTETAKRA